MDPNDNQNNQPLPPDYLDQIAAKSTIVRNGGAPKLGKPIIYGGITIVVLLFIMITTAIMIPSSSKLIPAEQLAARLSATQAVVTDATPKVKDSTLRKINAELSNYLTNTIRDIAAPLAEENLSVDKISKSVSDAESNAELLAAMEESRLNGTYDNDYAREMAYKLDTITNLMRQIYESKSTRSQNLKKFLENAGSNLDTIQKEFADFNSTTS